MLEPLAKTLRIRGRRYVTESDNQWYFTSWGYNWQWQKTGAVLAQDAIKHGARVVKQGLARGLHS